MIGHYQTARAFRAALEDRLKQTARALHIDLMRLRRQVAFDRFLSRLFAVPDAPWLLKGGYAFELRMGRQARATKDLDLTVPDPGRLRAGPDDVFDTIDILLDCLREAAAINLDDGFEFRLGAPLAELDATPYGGARYPIEARLDDRTFVTFHLDVGIGDAVIVAPERLTGPDTLGFAGIPPAQAAVLAREQQFAEKVHAYSLPRGERINTRVKDLVDLVLLLRLGLSNADTVKEALRATFQRRMTHPMPTTLEPPPDAWRPVFEHLATELELEVVSLDAAFVEVAAYWATLA